MQKQAPLSYTYFKKKRRILWGGIFLAFLQLILFVIYKGKGDRFVETLTDIRLFFGRLILDRIWIDCLAIGILFLFTLKLKDYISRHYPDSLREMIKVNLKYLLVILLSLVLFIPIAILLRHFIRNGFSFDLDRLIRNFRNFGKMYVEYLLPFSLVGYLFFNGNFYLQRPNKVKNFQPKSEVNNHKPLNNNGLLEVINDNGNIMIKVSDIFWIAKQDKVYVVKTAQNTFRIRKTIKELDEMLKPKGFLRINRGVIVNQKYLHNYSYWEYDKFILRMQDSDYTEFIVSRDRMKQIKHQLTKTG